MLEGWQHLSLIELTKEKGLQIGPFGSQLKAEEYTEDPDGVPVVMPRDILAGRIVSTQINRVPKTKAEKLKKHKLETGDILFPRRGDLSRIALVDDEQGGWLCGTGCLRARLTSGTDPKFLITYLNQKAVIDWLEANAVGQTMLNLNTEIISDLPVLAPPLPEQRKIAEILQTWDEALEKLTALRAAKDKRLGALRYAMLFGELRLDDQRRNWVPTRLASITHELTARNGAKGLGRDYVMGVTKAQGVVPMREQTIAGDISRYKRLPPRAFAYNPMRINVGSIAMNVRDEEVLVSPDYVVFACNADGLDPDYLDHLRKTSWWTHYINSGGSGSVRQRTYYDDLAALKLPLPELDEQKAIATVLNTARDDLAATEREIDAVTRQKRGLMQKLLTGEWRVPLDHTEISATTEEAEHAG
ncbi:MULTISPECIES: restriction endonuclease subunit S [Actibacterium]|nr:MULTISPECIES: restriction endonuclease subunit S [Actibacterium]